MNPQNLVNLTRQYQQSYLVYCFNIMQYLQALTWLETQKTPKKAPLKQPNTVTYSQKCTSGFNFFNHNPHQQKPTLKSLKHQAKADVSMNVVMGFPNGAMSAAFRVAFNDLLDVYKSLPEKLTVRIDKFDYKGESAFEIHVYEDSKKFRKAVNKGAPLTNFEKGIIGPTEVDGKVRYDWLNKHKADGKVPSLSTNQSNHIRQLVTDQVRARGHLPPVGQRPAGARWARGLRMIGRFTGPMAMLGMSSMDVACTMDPMFEVCN